MILKITTVPLLLTMFTILCTLPAAATVLPSAIAQEDEEDENLASSIVSEVLEDGDAEDESNQDATNTATINPNQEDNNDVTFGDDTNEQIAVPITTQDQRAANLAEQLGLDVDIVEEEIEEEVTPTPTPTPPPPVGPTCQGEPATIVGTPGNDDLSGTGARDVIALLEGDDRVNAGEGDDLICGDEGNDPLLVGDAGDDEVFGGEGNDVMFGGSDNDDLSGGAGDDDMSGGAGDDNLNSVDGVMNNDSLNGDTGTDTCISDPDPQINCEP
jgi:Ca2+-binding RTX toxin-like protein